MEDDNTEFRIELSEDAYCVLGGFNPITLLHESLSPADEPGVYKLTQEDMQKVQAALDKTAGWVPNLGASLNKKLQNILMKGITISENSAST